MTTFTWVGQRIPSRSAGDCLFAEALEAGFTAKQAHLLLAVFSTLTESQQSRILQTLGWKECVPSSSSS